MKIINNTRPDRQTVLFSATFPKQMEALARRVLENPLEIQVGGKSVVADTVTQYVEVLEEDQKFFKLLEVLGNYYDPEKRVLIFVDTQDAADNLFKELVGKGYACLSLHGGKEQVDRDQILNDFKTGDCPVLVATSVAARGLDVKQLHLVINYEAPNHLEDYVHRCGRTGRAGNFGVAYTFITPQQDRYAGDIIKALKQSKQDVPPKLQEIWDQFAKQNPTKVGGGGGFGGKGLEKIESDREEFLKKQKKALGIEEEGEEESAITEDGKPKITLPNLPLIPGLNAPPLPTLLTNPAAVAANPLLNVLSTNLSAPTAANSAPLAPPIVPSNDPALATAPVAEKKVLDVAQNALKAAKSKALALQQKLAANPGTNSAASAPPTVHTITLPESLLAAIPKAPESSSTFNAEVEINDYPPQAKFKVTNKDNISRISEYSGAAITTRGTYFPPGKVPKEGERKLFLYVEGASQFIVDKAVNEVKRCLTEATLQYIEKADKGKF